MILGSIWIFEGGCYGHLLSLLRAVGGGEKIIVAVGKQARGVWIYPLEVRKSGL